MALDPKGERVLEEGVLIVLGENLEPVALVRKASNNGGKIEIYDISPMSFQGVKSFLQTLAQKPLIIGKE